MTTRIINVLFAGMFAALIGNSAFAAECSGDRYLSVQDNTTGTFQETNVIAINTATGNACLMSTGETWDAQYATIGDVGEFDFINRDGMMIEIRHDGGVLGAELIYGQHVSPDATSAAAALATYRLGKILEQDGYNRIRIVDQAATRWTTQRHQSDVVDG